jgi:hypothetical protein
MKLKTIWLDRRYKKPPLIFPIRRLPSGFRMINCSDKKENHEQNNRFVFWEKKWKLRGLFKSSFDGC